MPVIQLILPDDFNQTVFNLDIVDTFELSGVPTISNSDTRRNGVPPLPDFIGQKSDTCTEY